MIFLADINTAPELSLSGTANYLRAKCFVSGYPSSNLVLEACYDNETCTVVIPKIVSNF